MEDIEIQDPQEESVETPQEEVQEDIEVESPEVEEEEEIDVDKMEIETRGKEEKEDEDADLDVDPDDLKTIEAIVEKKTQSFKKALQEAQDRAEIDAFVAQRPEFSKYKDVMFKYLQHPIYGKIPVKNIAAIVASNDLMKLGAKKEREAQAKAAATKNPGQAVRKPEEGAADWSKMSKTEFEAHRRKVLQTQ